MANQYCHKFSLNDMKLATNDFSDQNIMSEGNSVLYKGILSESLLAAYKYCDKFSLNDMKLATNDFSDQNKIRSEGYGVLYKGILGERLVAVKRLKRSFIQKESLSDEEIEARSLLRRHRHIEHIIGYCDEEGEKIFVYKFIRNHTLEYHLQYEHRSKLGWNVRLSILIGIARGLCHLHRTVPETSIIHCDVKSSNILLDENFVAKLGNFGLSKRGYIEKVDTIMPIETYSIDTYSFGIVMLEVLSGRLITGCGSNFVTSALQKQANDILDPLLGGNISQTSLNLYWNVAKTCLTNSRVKIEYVLVDIITTLKISNNESNNVNMSPSEPLSTRLKFIEDNVVPIPLSELKQHYRCLMERSARSASSVPKRS